MNQINKFKHFDKETPGLLDVLIGLMECHFDILFDLNTGTLLLLYLLPGEPNIPYWLKCSFMADWLVEALFNQVRKIRLDRDTLPRGMLVIELNRLENKK